ncbi:hypothetical protein [Streptomyces sp. NPDC048350]|uniref:hypothetical protein n=2 Tax=unclassified Streptomyces TaxID=2593676 RepID=UPI00371A228D
MTNTPSSCPVDSVDLAGRAIGTEAALRRRGEDARGTPLSDRAEAAHSGRAFIEHPPRRDSEELSISTVQAGWTVDRAERYLRDLTAGSRRMAEMVIVDGDGYLEADKLRDVIGKLNGPSNGLTRAVPRGVRKGWWPEGTPAPITPVSDPANPSWHQNIAYRMDKELVPVFREALTRIIGSQPTEDDQDPDADN